MASVTERPRPALRLPRLARLRERQWSPAERAVVIALIAIALGALFVTTYSLALGDPVAHRIDAGVVGDRATHSETVDAVQRVVHGNLSFRQFASVPQALHAMDLQQVYTTLDLSSVRPTLYVSSAAGESVARVLEGISAVDPTVRVVDAHPLEAADPSGVDIFYLMLVTTIIGFLSVLQVRINAGGLTLSRWIVFVVSLAVCASLVLTLVDGPLLHRLDLPVLESWGILAVHLLAVASFASFMVLLIGRWALIPIWLFFVVLGNSSSGGPVAPPLLPPPFAFVSQWLPSGATVTALRNAVYFHDFQHARPLLVIAVWATTLFGAMVVTSRRLGRSPGIA